METLFRFIVAYVLANPGSTTANMRAAAVAAGHQDADVTTAATLFLDELIATGLVPAGAVYADVGFWVTRIGVERASHILRSAAVYAFHANPNLRRAELTAARSQLQTARDLLIDMRPHVDAEIARLADLARTEAEEAIFKTLQSGRRQGVASATAWGRNIDKLTSEIEGLG